MQFYKVTATTDVKVFFDWVGRVVDDEDMGYTYDWKKVTQIEPTDPVETKREALELADSDDNGNRLDLGPKIHKTATEIDEFNRTKLKMVLFMKEPGNYKISLKYLRAQ